MIHCILFNTYWNQYLYSKQLLSSYIKLYNSWFLPTSIYEKGRGVWWFNFSQTQLQFVIPFGWAELYLLWSCVARNQKFRIRSPCFRWCKIIRIGCYIQVKVLKQTHKNSQCSSDPKYPSQMFLKISPRNLYSNIQIILDR